MNDRTAFDVVLFVKQSQVRRLIGIEAKYHEVPEAPYPARRPRRANLLAKLLTRARPIASGALNGRASRIDTSWMVSRAAWRDLGRRVLGHPRRRAHPEPSIGAAMPIGSSRECSRSPPSSTGTWLTVGVAPSDRYLTRRGDVPAMVATWEPAW